jgi:hypothetical protein
MTFLFDSRTDSYHIGIRFAFPGCYVRSSQIQRRCQKFRFGVLLMDLKMTTLSGISVEYYDVHHVPVMTAFIRWCQSP